MKRKRLLDSSFISYAMTLLFITFAIAFLVWTTTTTLKSVNERQFYNNNSRAVLAYLNVAIKQTDHVAVKNNVLILADNDDNGELETRIFVDGGKLIEYYTFCEMEYLEGYGEVIADCDYLNIKVINDKLLYFETPYGNIYIDFIKGGIES